MNFAGLLFLLFAHYLSGKGVLRLFGIVLPRAGSFCVAMITGVALLSFAPCCLQLLHIPITSVAVTVAVCLLTALYAMPLLRRYKKPEWKLPPRPVYYEWPFMVLFLFFMALSAWRCFYYPPYARDMLAGPELLAAFAVKEHTMISSVFTIDLQGNNNYFKSPFITCLQIMYKLLVCPFGQVWLSAVSLPFLAWMYSLLRQRLHPLMAGVLMLLFITIPELYCYSYIMLYDYSNMVFFFGGYYFLALFMKHDDRRYFLYAAFLFGIATYIRTETLLLTALTAPVLLPFFFRRKYGLQKTAIYLLQFLLIPVAFYVLCIPVFVQLFIPIPFHPEGQIGHDLQNISFFFTRMSDMFSRLIFCAEGIRLFGYFIFIFCAILITDLLVMRKCNREGRIALYGVVVVLLGMPLLGYLLPLVDVDNTTKRGLFKVFPMMLLYLGNSALVQYISARAGKWEHAPAAEKTKK